MKKFLLSAIAVSMVASPILAAAPADAGLQLRGWLLDASANPDLKGRGFTPLGTAALQGQVRIVRLLLKAGADVDRKSNDGNTPIIAATLMHRTDVVRELLAYHPDMTIWNREGRVSLGIAVEQGDTDIVTMMLAAGVDPNLMDRNGNRPLFWAGDRQDIATMLVARGGTSF
ncbi:MAG: ankyrin repeat domain-containing protein [Betaproteobacteria bacterium]|nr:ankyrin repeat domain-containing protein [Betaproteobacteria bacterium]